MIERAIVEEVAEALEEGEAELADTIAEGFDDQEDGTSESSWSSESESESQSDSERGDLELDEAIEDMAFKNLIEIQRYRYLASRLERVPKDLNFCETVLPYLSPD